MFLESWLASEVESTMGIQEWPHPLVVTPWEAPSDQGEQGLIKLQPCTPAEGGEVLTAAGMVLEPWQ